MENGEQEPVTTGQIASRIYDRAGLDTHLLGYAQGDFDEMRVEPALAQFSSDLAHLSYRGGNIDVELVRAGFDHLTGGYNTAANEVFGGAPPRTIGRAILQTLHILQPKEKTYYRGLDDKYWQKQFLKDLESFPMRPGETPEECYERYIQSCMKGLSWANFTYIRGA